MHAKSRRNLSAAALVLTALSIAGGFLAPPPQQATTGASAPLPSQVIDGLPDVDAPLPSQVIDGLILPDVDAQVDGESIVLPDDGGSTAE